MQSKLKKWFITAAALYLGWLLFLAPNRTKTDSMHDLVYIEKVFHANPGDVLPMVIVLHGDGGDEKTNLNLLQRYQLPHRMISLRGPHGQIIGYRWNERVVHAETTAAAYAILDQQMKDSAQAVAASVDYLINKYPTQGKPYVIGFSSGAMISYRLAVKHPEHFSAVFPIAGYFKGNDFPSESLHELPPVFAYHGTQDRSVSFTRGKSTVENIRKLSDRVQLKQADVGHEIPGFWRRDISEKISMIHGGKL